MKKALCFLMQIMALHLMAQDVTINEFMSLNETTFTDEDGDFPDWLELYNNSDETVNLTGWFLSDDESNPWRWQINDAEISAHGFLVIFASSKDRSGPGQLHTNFNISSSGETLLLTNNLGVTVDQIEPIILTADLSYGSSVDGLTSDQIYFSTPSPGASNSTGIEAPYTADALSFSVPGGFYENSFSLTLSSDLNAEIRYTLDGSEPSATSSLYTSALNIQDKQGQADVISLINTGVNWQAPKTNGEKATVIKAASFIQGIRSSAIYTQSYFISKRMNERYKGRPVISLTVNADSLFSSARGIYVAGQNYSASAPTGSGNYFQGGDDWEREVHMEFFDEFHAKQFAQNVGARIHGNTSRYHPQKTLRLYARDEYGQSTFDYPFFDEKDIDQFKRILLRNGSSDFAETMFKDILCSELVSEMEVDYMASEVCIVFINGEYWGVHSIRERIDENYLAENHGIHPDSVDMLALNAEVEHGSSTAYHELLNYVSTHDLSQVEAYEHVIGLLDLENFMDYQIAQLYFANFDWPNVNIRFWKGHSVADKWRWIFYDCDRCMVLPNYDHLIDFIQENNQTNFSQEWTLTLFNKLLKNPAFKADFVQRFFFHLSTTFNSDRVLAKLNELEEIHRPLMVEHINRWHYPSSMNIWNESLQELRGFVIKRPAVMVQQLMEYIGEQYSLYPNPVTSADGYVNLEMEYRDGVDILIDIYTTIGESVFSTDLNDQANVSVPRIPITRLSPGLYLLRIQYGALVFTEKLVVE